MERSNKIMKALKKVLTLVMVFAIAVSFSQPLTAQAKAKVKTVNLKKLDLTTDVEAVRNGASELTKGKSVVKISKIVNKTYHGYAKFTAPETKTYTIKFSNVKPTKGKANSILGAVTGYRLTGHSMMPLNNLGPKKLAGMVNLGNKSFSTYKKSYTSKITLNEGETLYLGFSFQNPSKNKGIQMDISIK